MTGVRWRKPDGFEGQCEACLQWFPLDREFWIPQRGLRLCRVCDRIRVGMRLREYRKNPETRARHNAKQREYHREARHALSVARAERKIAQRIADPSMIERQRGYQREYMRRKRAAA